MNKAALTWALAATLVAGLTRLSRPLYLEILYESAARPSFAKPVADLPPCPRCNLIILSMDTLRADFASKSPELQKIAAQALTYQNAYANAFYTTPSHMTLFTSLYPNRHKVSVNIRLPRWPRATETEILSKKYHTLAEALDQAGYQTRWYAPLSVKHLSFELGFGRGFQRFSPSLFGRLGQPGLGFNARELRKALSSAQPFFYFLHSYVTHSPYFLPQGPGEFAPLFEERRLTEDYAKSARANKPRSGAADAFLHDLGQYQLWAMEKAFAALPLSKREVLSESLRRAYAQSARALDLQIGEMWRAFKASGRDHDTIVVLLSDHGEELFEHGHGEHSSFYQHTARVPLIFYHPRLTKPLLSSELVSLVDVMPTLLKLLEIKGPEQMQGRDLTQASPSRPVFGFALGIDYVFDGEWKLIRGLTGEEELYHLPTDPEERRNLAAERWPRAQTALKRLREKRRAWETEQAL